VTTLNPVREERLRAFYSKIQLYHTIEDRENCEISLSYFLERAWSYIDSAEYQSGWAINAMADHLEAVVSGDIRRLLMNIPPRCSKTTLLSIAFPAWVWAQSEITYLSGPQVQFLCASYGHTLSLDSSNKCRRLINSPWYQGVWGSRFRLTDDQNTKYHFENDKGGARIATSVGGSLLGLGGAILIADDLNNTEQVESEAERETVKNFWQEFHSTRLNDPKQSAIIVIQQRLHEHDVSGLILESDEPFVHLRVPMRYEANYTYHTVKLPQYEGDELWDDPRSEEGELMWPERFGEREVRRLEVALGPYMAAGRLQQRPSPKGGGILQRDWWQPWDKIEAAKYGLEWITNRREYPTFELVIGSLDTAYGEKEENDFNALTIWGLFIDVTGSRRALLAYAWNKRLPLNGTVLVQRPGEIDVNFRDRQKQAWGLVETVADTCKRYKVQRLLIENKTRGVDVANELRRLYSRDDWGIQLINPVRDKVSRAHSVVPLFTDGSVYAPTDRKWCAEVIDQACLFPKSEHDDMVDSLTQALKWMRETGLLLRAEEQEAEIADSIRFYNREESVRERYGV
jgi:predicted phage terminase large subunit-like protein